MKPIILAAGLSLILLIVGSAAAQSTTFTYQGKLSDNGSPANGNYDFQFKLYDTLNQTIGVPTITVNNVAVAGGIFTVNLDFGACGTCFNGSPRYLEIAVKPVGIIAYTTLSPRQLITSTPYAIRALNAQTAVSADGLSALCVNCINSSQIGSVNGSAVTGTISVSSIPAGSDNYVQNGTSQQANSNFNISGDGTAAGTLSGSIVNAAAQYNLGGQRLLLADGSDNLIAGINAGQSNTGSGNAFFGRLAGFANTTGFSNSFFGTNAGASNTSSGSNSFFGAFAGRFNTTGANNSFYGRSAGEANTTGFSNSFFGRSAGEANTTGGNNAFFGRNGGAGNTTGAGNSFFGAFAGAANTTTNNNSFFGAFAGQANALGGNNSFFGFSAGVATDTGSDNAFFGMNAGFSNTGGTSNAFFGRSAGQSNTTACCNAFFGTAAGQNNATGSDNAFFGTNAGLSNLTGFNNSFFGRTAGFANNGSNNSFFGANAGLNTTLGVGDSFFGSFAGSSNTTGVNNLFLGLSAGSTNTTGSRNTFVGGVADFSNPNPSGNDDTLLGHNSKVSPSVSNATAIGANATVTQSNSLVLGAVSGVNTGTSVNVGIGTTAPATRLHVSGTGTIRARVDSDSNAGLSLTLNNQPGWSVATTTGSQFQIFNDALGSNAVWIDSASNNVGIGSVASSTDKLYVAGDIRVGTSGTNGCLKNNNGGTIIGTCSSDARFKRDVVPFAHLLDRVAQLQPVHFYWRTGEFPGKGFGQAQEAGLIAQEVEKVLPELVSTDAQGFKAVNYAQLPLLSLQAIKELKAENDALKQQLNAQQQQIEAVKRLLCQSNPRADLCKATQK